MYTKILAMIKKDSFLWLMMVLIVTISVWVQFNTFVNWDLSWGVTIANRMLQGGQYCNDFFENNPPLVFYIFALPVSLAKLTGLNYKIWARLLIFMLGISSIFLSDGSLKKIFQKDNPVIYSLCLLGLCYTFFLLPVTAFAEREHLMVMLIMPYVWLLVLRSFDETIRLNTGFCVIVGICAAIGFALKPYFLITLVLLEFYFAARKRNLMTWLRIETLIIFSMGIAYLVSIFLLTPAYIYKMLPYVAHFYLQYGDYTPQVLLSNPYNSLWFSALLASFLLRNKIKHPSCLLILNITAFGFFVSYWLQGKVWYYHIYPEIVFSCLIILLLIGECWQQAKGSVRDYFLIYLGVLSFVLIYTQIDYTLIMINNSIQDYKDPDSAINQIIKITKDNATHQNIYVFSTQLAPVLFIDYADANNTSRFPHLWLLQGIVAAKNPDDPAVKQAQQFLFNAVIEDLKLHQPQLVLVEDNDPGYKKPLDYIPYFSQNEQFKSLWAHYRVIDDFDGMKFYKRIS